MNKAKNRSATPIIFILVLAGLIVLSQSVFTVDQRESAIVVQFGKPVPPVITNAGLQFKVPFVQDVIFLDNRIMDYDAAAKDIVTKDKKTIAIDNFAKWRIVDSLLFFQSVRNIQGAHARLDEIVYSELRVEVGSNNLTEIVSVRREAIMKAVTKRSDKAGRKYGFEVIAVRTKRADLPEANELAVYNRMKAERERDAKRYRSEGEEEAAKIRSEADKEKTIILAEAEKEAQQIKGDGDAEALKIYADAFGLDPEFYQFTRTLEAYQKTLKEKTTLVLTPDSEFLKYLKKSK